MTAAERGWRAVGHELLTPRCSFATWLQLLRAKRSQHSTAQRSTLQIHRQHPIVFPSAVLMLETSRPSPTPCAKRRLKLAPRIAQHRRAATSLAAIHVHQCFSRTKTKPRQLTANRPTCQRCCQDRRCFAANRLPVRRMYCELPAPVSSSAARLEYGPAARIKRWK